MNKNRIVPILCLLILCVSLVACEKRVVKNDLKSTEKLTEDIEVTNETEKEVTYKEYDGYFRISDTSYYDNIYVDDTILDWSSWERVGKSIYIESPINIYDENKAMIGYTKSDIDVIYVATNGEWSNLAIGGNGSSVYVRTDELEYSMPTEDNEIVKDTETSTEVDSEPTYTVIDMTKTMYAKQSVNVRSGPSSDYENLGSLTTNQEVLVTGQADTGWYRIDYNGGVAYVSNNYLSDTKVEVVFPDDGENTNEDENDSGEEYIPPADDNTDDEKPNEPTYTYTVDEVITIVRNTLENNGMMWYPDVFPNSEDGPSGGMSWGMDWIPMNDPYTYANSMVEGFQYQGFDLYYIEYLYTENGKVVFKTYFGDLPNN